MSTKSAHDGNFFWHFHALGIALATKSRIWINTPYSCLMTDVVDGVLLSGDRFASSQGGGRLPRLATLLPNCSAMKDKDRHRRGILLITTKAAGSHLSNMATWKHKCRQSNGVLIHAWVLPRRFRRILAITRTVSHDKDIGCFICRRLTDELCLRRRGVSNCREIAVATLSPHGRRYGHVFMWPSNVMLAARGQPVCSLVRRCGEIKRLYSFMWRQSNSRFTGVSTKQNNVYVISYTKR